MNDERDFVKSLAQAPPSVLSQSETPKAATWRDDDSQSAMPDRHAHSENRVLEFQQKASPLPASNSTMAVPAKTGSLLSQISAMVSDEGTVPYSQNSIRRSAPSNSRRMRPAPSTKRSRAPVQIQEESPISHSDHAPNGQCNDLDLYADYNGVVKDLCDETGKPLRIAEAEVPNPPPQHEPMESRGTNVEVACESRDAEQPRYSTERPMSFIAGSTDEDGKPQDQINQSTTPDDIRARRTSGQHHSSQQGIVYSELPTGSLDPPQNPVQSPPTPSIPPPKNVMRTIKSLDPTRPAKHVFIDQNHPSGQANPEQLLSQTQSAHDHLPQNSHTSSLALHQPQAQRISQIPQIIPNLPREPASKHTSECQGAGQGSENQQEPHQRDRQSTISAQSSVHETSKAQKNDSSKTKMSSKFKIFGGKNRASSQQRSSEDSVSVDSNLPEGKQEHSKSFTSKKPQSSDQVSQNSHKSFFDLRKPKGPEAVYSIPYHQFQSTANVQSVSGQSARPAATGANKTSRFSGLGSIFSRDGPSAPKEDKKALKAQKRAADPQARREWDPVKGVYKSPNDQKPQEVQSPRQSVSDTRSEESSAFLSTKRLAEEHQAQIMNQNASQANNHSRASSLVHQQAGQLDLMRQLPSDPPQEYYNPNAGQAGDERGAYAATVMARRQQEQLQAQHQRERVTYGQGSHRDPRYEQRHPQPFPGQPVHQHWLGPGNTSRTNYSHDILNAASSEPRYEATPIPAAYSHVSGAYVAPSARQEQSMYPSQQFQTPHVLTNHVGMQSSNSWTPVVSPLLSPQSQMHPSNLSYPDASTMHVVSPISQSVPPPGLLRHPSVHRAHRPRMSSISEVQQQDRPWHLNLPAGATEQEIVRARQGQYMQDLFNAQQQQQAERAARSPSPRTTPQHQIPSSTAPNDYAQGSGFREILPTSSSQAYSAPPSGPPYHEQQSPTHHHPAYEQQIPVRSGSSPHPAAYPLPASRNSMRVTSPLDPPPQTPHSPAFRDAQMHQNNGQQHYQNHSPTDHAHQTPLVRAPQYDVQVPDEAPPSYEGIGVPNEGMDKSRPDAVRPPNINTDVDREDHGQRPGSRPRQPSIGMLQHPQPASMAASPQRTLSDMGAESLRRQLLQQENLIQMERVQREKERHEAIVRERLEREAARARARELERSVSSGGQVSSLHSARGSFNSGSGSGWERRGSHSRQVFELSALDDDEPVMSATSYPGQEWVPPMWET